MKFNFLGKSPSDEQPPSNETSLPIERVTPGDSFTLNKGDVLTIGRGPTEYDPRSYKSHLKERGIQLVMPADTDETLFSRVICRVKMAAEPRIINVMKLTPNNGIVVVANNTADDGKIVYELPPLDTSSGYIREAEAFRQAIVTRSPIVTERYWPDIYILPLSGDRALSLTSTGLGSIKAAYMFRTTTVNAVREMLQPRRGKNDVYISKHAK